MNRYERHFPVGTRVHAFTEGGMLEGTITIHTVNREEGEDGLIVTFDDGVWIEYPYHLLDLDNPDNSYIVKTIATATTIEGEETPYGRQDRD